MEFEPKSMCFIGMEEFSNIDDWEIAIEGDISDFFYCKNVRTFYFSSKNVLSSKCYRYIYKYKKEGSDRKTILVIDKNTNIMNLMVVNLFDEVIVVDKNPDKYCIDNSDFIMCFYLKDKNFKNKDFLLNLIEYSISNNKNLTNCGNQPPDYVRFNYIPLSKRK